MKNRFAYCLLLSGIIATSAHAQRGYVRDAVRDKEYKEHGAEGEDKLNGWLGNLTDVKGACFFNGTMFQIDGYANYGCRFEVCDE